MKTTLVLVCLVVLASTLFNSCEKLEKASDVPEIHFKSLTGPFLVDTAQIPYYAADLTFSFIDGNADIGADRDSTTNNNLILLPFEKKNGVYDSVNADIYGRKWKITKDEHLNNTSGRPVRGEIKVQIQYLVFPPPFDTMRYDFYLIDQAGHHSNVESSSDIVFSH